ncbi:electron transporter [Iris pallida]|uniref:Electron transporter n=1 Tax=Iris pallida TaxID=29817 RepID=A0AAX6DPQ4_IRIPA|nr:electron transporter [Iris pallida]
MWPRWNNTPPRGSTSAAEPDSAPRTASRLHSSFSFKDVHSLLLLLDAPNPNPNPPVPSRKPSIFHRVRIASAALRTWKSLPPAGAAASAAAAAGDRRIVVYYTSLRVVRKTFEDCRAVVSILRGFRVAVDERDLSMDSGFLGELRGILGGRRQLSLPRVFIGGRHIGGAEEVQLLHESGELKKLVEGLPALEAGTGTGTTCEACAGVRFALCGSCNGSHKYYHSEKAAFRTCSACNENGLVRCPACCSDS